MDDPVVIMVTAPSEEAAEAVAKPIVQEGLAACVNVVPGLRSLYIWKGELCDDSEVLLIVKSRRSFVDRVVRRVKELHTYEVPEVIALPIIAGSEDYLNWMSDLLT